MRLGSPPSNALLSPVFSGPLVLVLMFRPYLPFWLLGLFSRRGACHRRKTSLSFLPGIFPLLLPHFFRYGAVMGRIVYAPDPTAAAGRYLIGDLLHLLFDSLSSDPGFVVWFYSQASPRFPLTPVRFFQILYVELLILRRN